MTINISSDETQTDAALDRLLCSEKTTAGIKDQLVFLSVVHIFLSIAAFLRNALIQVALSIIPSTMFFWNENMPGWCGIIVTLLGLVISAFSYTNIFFKLRHHQSQVHNVALQQQPSQAGQLNIARYGKAVYSALWLQLTLVVCYLPYGIIVDVLWMFQEFSPPMYLAGYIAATLVILNSSLNPILYCWKIREVRQAVKDTIRHVF